MNGQDSFSLFILCEFKLDESILLKKKIKSTKALSGKELKCLVNKEFNESDLIRNYTLSKILVNDADFENELMDVTDDELFMVNFKVFIQVLTVKKFFILNLI